MHLKKVISKAGPELIQHGKFNLAKLRHEKDIRVLKDKEVDAIIVEHTSVLQAVLLDSALYLKPLFVQGKTEHNCDGFFDPNQIDRIIGKIEILTKEIEVYQNLALPKDPNKRLITKVIRYLLTRKLNLEPKNTRLAKIGYSYPLIEDFSIEYDPIHILKHLNNYTEEGLFIENTIDKVNVCYECQSSYLNFSECCTKCNSLDLETEELVHHFRCAYVGPQSDFTKAEGMVCPKCDHQLKHIGIDYDKPSEIHNCKSCNHSSQETKMKAKCVDCCKENALEQLTTYSIHNYQVSEKGKAFALEHQEEKSFGTSSSDMENSFTNFGVFNMIKKHEARRIHSNGLSTYHIETGLKKELLSSLNTNLKQALVEELTVIIRPYLKENDLIAIDAQYNIHMLFIDYTTDAYAILLDTLQYNLNKMLRDNAWGEDSIAIEQAINLEE